MVTQSGRHGRSAWSVGRGSAPSRPMVMVFGVFGETLCPWLHCPTLPADILFHWDSYQKNSSILERCVILIYYVVEIRMFKVWAAIPQLLWSSRKKSTPRFSLRIVVSGVYRYINLITERGRVFYPTITLRYLIFNNEILKSVTH